jgi:hypothetical protein
MEKMKFVEKAKNWLDQTDFVSMNLVLDEVQEVLIEPTDDDARILKLIRKIRNMKDDINDLSILGRDADELD